MYFVDRSVAVIKPKQPFVDWLNQVPDNDMELSLDSLRADCTVILIPEFDEPEELADVGGVMREIEAARLDEERRQAIRAADDAPPGKPAEEPPPPWMQ